MVAAVARRRGGAPRPCVFGGLPTGTSNGIRGRGYNKRGLARTRPLLCQSYPFQEEPGPRPLTQEPHQPPHPAPTNPFIEPAPRDRFEIVPFAEDFAAGGALPAGVCFYRFHVVLRAFNGGNREVHYFRFPHDIFPRHGADETRVVGVVTVVAHHEKYDGSGYPRGLRGEDIPFGARILAVADAFDTMTTSRSYRAALSIEYALSELRKCTGTQFCPVAVEAFISGFEQHRKKSSNPSFESGRGAT